MIQLVPQVWIILTHTQSIILIWSHMPSNWVACWPARYERVANSEECCKSGFFRRSECKDWGCFFPWSNLHCWWILWITMNFAHWLNQLNMNDSHQHSFHGFVPSRDMEWRAHGSIPWRGRLDFFRHNDARCTLTLWKPSAASATAQGIWSLPQSYRGPWATDLEMLWTTWRFFQLGKYGGLPHNICIWVVTLPESQSEMDDDWGYP